MKKAILYLILACFVLTSNAKSWSVIGDALETDTMQLNQDASNPNIYKYVGKLTNNSFKLFDGSHYYVSVCGLSDPFDQQVDMEQQTDVSQVGFRVSYVNPDDLYRITLTDETIPKIKIEIVTPYDNIYLIGGPVNTHDPNWLFSDVRELENDPSNPFVFYYRGFLNYNTFGDEPGAFKFLTSNSAWDPAFHPAEGVNTLIGQASKMSLDGGDTKWEIPADGSANGYYVIKINTLDETISVEEFQHANVDYPAYVYITGDAMPCGWVNDTPETMSATNILEGKYSWSGTVIPGQFKFLDRKGTWGSCIVSTVFDNAVKSGETYPIVSEFEYYNNDGNDFKFMVTESIRCIINVDLANMEMSFTEETQSSIDNLKLDHEISIFAKDQKIIISSTSASKKQFRVFAIDGRKIYSSSFVSHSEVSLPKGYYIVAVSDDHAQHCEKICVLN